MLLNRALGRQQRYQEARESCRAALAVDPGEAGAWAELAMVSMALLDEQPALAAVARALELEPQDPFVLVRAGLVQDFFGRHEEAGCW
jgi:Flp pilus assembly protein TadD